MGALQLLGSSSPRKLTELTPETTRYFQKLPGYDTLRMVLARKVVLVEGPSDEMIFERIFEDMFDKRPIELGIDVLSIRGVSLGRCLELCAALDKTVAAIRDNDGIDPAELRVQLQQWIEGGRREVFIGPVEQGRTLEPQLRYHNSDQTLRKVIGITEATDLAGWMERNKTECALRIADSMEAIQPPAYMREAAAFIHG